MTCPFWAKWTGQIFRVRRPLDKCTGGDMVPKWRFPPGPEASRHQKRVRIWKIVSRSTFAVRQSISNISISINISNCAYCRPLGKGTRGETGPKNRSPPPPTQERTQFRIGIVHFFDLSILGKMDRSNFVKFFMPDRADATLHNSIRLPKG